MQETESFDRLSSSMKRDVFDAPIESCQEYQFGNLFENFLASEQIKISFLIGLLISVALEKIQ